MDDFMLAALALIREKLPPMAIQALDVFDTYRSGRESAVAVVDKRVQCFAYMEQMAGGRVYGNPLVNAVGAATYLLYPEEDRLEFVDHLAEFTELANSVEPHYDEQELLLRKYFAKGLSEK